LPIASGLYGAVAISNPTGGLWQAQIFSWLRNTLAASAQSCIFNEPFSLWKTPR
jgi:hypothetical protein